MPHVTTYFLAVASPGKSSDQAAIEQKTTATALEDLLFQSHLVGDAAYTLTDKCLTPFTGSQRLNPSKDTYNLFLSQVRIRIEMAFGLLTTKLQMLKKTLTAFLQVSVKVLEVISRLHNFCIDMRSCDLSDDIDEIIPLHASLLGGGGGVYLSTVETLVPLSVPGSSQIHDVIVNIVSQNGSGHPDHDIVRHREELHKINFM